MSWSAKNEETCELQHSIQLIRNVVFFAGLSADFHRVLAYLCERQTYTANEIILHEGEAADGAVILTRGTGHIFYGEQFITSAESGSCAGGLALLGQFRWLYTLRAKTDVECLLLPRHKFLPQCKAQPDALLSVTRELINAIVDWDQHQLAGSGELHYGLGLL